MKESDQKNAPLFHALVQFIEKKPVSFHVPGHKNGTIFPADGRPFFQDILRLDQTELTGLDDLHAAEGVIEQAQQLAAAYFHADKTHFLVGGSTAGNLAMILAVCGPGDVVIVQRNSHKSILHALELSGARPVFVSSSFDEAAGRYSAPSFEAVAEAIDAFPQAKGLVLTYPDYFGKTYPIQELIDMAHTKAIPVLVDEAHGVHFSSSEQFPCSSLEFGADVVVHSAHKMAPAMTMASFLHIKSKLVSPREIAHYLQMVQSSSPSYPLMASLDLARAYLAALTEEEVTDAIASAGWMRKELGKSKYWKVVSDLGKDPLKITIEAKKGVNAKQLGELFEKAGIYPELATDSHVLFVHGLEPYKEWKRFAAAVEKIEEQLKNIPRHATIDVRIIPQAPLQQLEVSYQEMRKMQSVFVSWPEAAGKVAAESVIPYPPGIPLICKGEKITADIASRITGMVNQGINFQNNHLKKGIEVFIFDQAKGE